ADREATTAPATPADRDATTADAVDEGAGTARDGDHDRGPSVGARDEDAPGPPATTEDRPASTVVPATVANGGITGVGRRALEVPLVRQLGVPAVLLLVVLIGALIAAGAFAGRDEQSVAPVTRPTIPTVPADPTEIPPLR
ncbi:MAG: hypothetical protein Q7T67_04430, partial [Patulibacter sp.]